mgnify:CR=1 FL=1
MEILAKACLVLSSPGTSIPMRILLLILLVAVTGSLGLSALGGPLNDDPVTNSLNNVKDLDPAKGSNDAATHDTRRDDMYLKTGVKSRA